MTLPARMVSSVTRVFAITGTKWGYCARRFPANSRTIVAKPPQYLRRIFPLLSADAAATLGVNAKTLQSHSQTSEGHPPPHNTWNIRRQGAEPRARIRFKALSFKRCLDQSPQQKT